MAPQAQSQHGSVTRTRLVAPTHPLVQLLPERTCTTWTRSPTWYALTMKWFMPTPVTRASNGVPTSSPTSSCPRLRWRVAARKGVLKTVFIHDREAESRKASVRAKVEHPYLVLKRDFGFAKTRYRGLAKNLNHLHVAFASVNLLMRARAVAIMTA